MPSSQPEMVMFDLDSTLVESIPNLTYSLYGMLQRSGVLAAREMKTGKWVGNGIKQLMKQVLHFASNDLNKESDTSVLKKALPLFISEYRQNTRKRSRLYNSVKGGLNYHDTT